MNTPDVIIDMTVTSEHCAIRERAKRLKITIIKFCRSYQAKKKNGSMAYDDVLYT